MTDMSVVSTHDHSFNEVSIDALSYLVYIVRWVLQEASAWCQRAYKSVVCAGQW